METIARKKNEPICKEALDYVRHHVYMPFSNREFCIIEKYVVEKHDSLYPDGYYGDGDLKNYVYGKLAETNILIPILIPQPKVDAIVNSLYDFMCETGILLPITLDFYLETWYDWDSILTAAIRSFKEKYACYPNIVLLSEHTKDQIDYVTSISPKSQIYGDHINSFTYSDVIDNQVETCTVKFQIDNEVPYKHFVLWKTPDDDDNDDDNNNDPIRWNTPVGVGSKQQSN
ncbi:hypothetical protein FACS189431_6540 [Alphaproteobacteria bacterium]|nr:hypothetical protein FACS189431_6540 [Alphaproteobacteria bacterium]